MNQSPISINSGSTLSKSSVDNVASEEPLVAYGRKKMSIYNFNFTPLLDDHVIKQQRPHRGYRVYQDSLPYTEPMRKTQKPVQQSVDLPEQAKIDAVLKGKVEVSDHKFFFEPLQLLRKEKDMGKKQDDSSKKVRITTASVTSPDKRELAALHTVCAPKTGAIKLTGLAYELDYPAIFDDRKKVRCQRKKQDRLEMLNGPTHVEPFWTVPREMLNKPAATKLTCQDKEFLDDTVETSKGHSEQLNTQVGGLLMFEIPEVPTLNNNIQKFVEGNINCNAEASINECPRNNMAKQDKDIKQHSNHYHGIYSVNNLKTTENIPQQRKLPVTTTSSSIATDLNNDTSVPDTSTKHRNAVLEIWRYSENSNKEISNFHQALVNAKNINQSYINKLRVTDSEH